MEYFKSFTDYDCNDVGIFANVQAGNRKLSSISVGRTNLI